MTSRSPYQMTMNAAMRLSLIFFFLVLGANVSAQSKAELERQRDALNEKIAYTRKLIDEKKEGQEATYEQLRILREQINYRTQLLASYEKEIRRFRDEIQSTESEIRELESKIARMKEEYAEMIRQAYKNRRNYDEMMYIFASEDFNQAFKRFKILQEYADYRKRQANEIRSTQEALQQRVTQLEIAQREKERLLGVQRGEAAELDGDRKESEAVLARLKSEESNLRAQQQQQEAERQRVNAAIRKIIEEELAAAKKSNDGRFELTPEGKIVSAEFEKNKGTLPWPVTRGVITGRFGKQAHESIPGITIENNGVDIATEEGSSIRSVFDGTVTSVFAIPGAGKNVIVTHGAYKSVYTNLSKTEVKKGDTVVAGQVIGTVLTANGKTTAHLEIWKMAGSGPQPQNPEVWIRK